MHIKNIPLTFDSPLMSLSAHSIQGRRDHMEDKFDICYQMKPTNQRLPNEWPYEFFYFGIFDGHGGEEASSFARQNLVKFITNQKDFWSNDDEDIMRAIRVGFAETQKAMKNELPKWSKTNTVLPSTAGTTASVLFIKNGKYYTGHVGDSRIVISQEHDESKMCIATQLTNDHKPELASEITRINRAGGEVRDKLGVHRVVWKRPNLYHMKPIPKNGVADTNEIIIERNIPETYPLGENEVIYYDTIPFLAIARSLGDFWSLNLYTGQYIVSPEPDVSCRPISPNDKSIILGTDGLWNVIGSSLAVRILQELEIVKMNKRIDYPDLYYTVDNFYDVAGDNDMNYAKSLVYFAYQAWERRSVRSDNITVVVAMLHDILSTSNHMHQSTERSPLLSINTIHADRYEPKPKLIQLGFTDTFSEVITWNQEPKFSVPNLKNGKSNDIMNRLESFLIFPPTILQQECEFDDLNLIYPLNYTRLSLAPYRILQDEFDPDSIIFIKHVTDDPADEVENPTRVNKYGKEVKDSSAQATQSIHDFGQPWNQLLSSACSKVEKEQEEPKDLNEDLEDMADDDELDFDLSYNKDENKRRKKDDDFLETHTKINKLESKSWKSVRSRRERRSIPQLRCLMNCPPSRSRSSTSECSAEFLERRTRSGRYELKRKRMVTQSEQCNLPVV